MFTGLIEGIGIVVSAEPGALTVELPENLGDLARGESVAIDGVDLTITTLEGRVFSANVMPETYRRSTLGNFEPGRRVNIERAVLPTTRLSGHLVRGVVEGTATVLDVAPEADALIYHLSTETELLEHVTLKGPVALDGASLTVIDLSSDGFAVSVVAYSQSHTTITERHAGDLVNVETDLVARYVGAAVARRLEDR
jgi:riboflavin synthase